MALPVIPVRLPSSLAGQTNGKLPDSILVSTPGQLGGPIVRLVDPAWRAWRALQAAAKAAGHILKATSFYDSYRPYEVQEATFLQRYTTTPNGTEPKWWRGQNWYLKPGYAPAAVPGTSNHGWALAIDIGEEKDGDSGTESIDAETVEWLRVNAPRFGFSAELQSEPWHWRYFAGDDIPPAVLAYEKSLEGDVKLFQVKGDPGQWVSNGLRRRPVQNRTELDAIRLAYEVTTTVISTPPAGYTVDTWLTAVAGPIDTELGGGGGSLPAFPWTVTFSGEGTVTS